MKLYIFCVIALFSSYEQRELSEPEFNPDCNGNVVCNNSSNDTNNMFVTKSTSETDVFYFIWSSIGLPSFLFIQTDPSAVLTVNWDSMSSHHTDVPVIEINNGTVLSSSGYIFSGIWNCTTSDSHDATRIHIAIDPVDCPLSGLSMINLGNITWDNTSHTISSIGTDNSGFQFMLRSQDPSFDGGSLSIQVTIYDHSGRDEVLLALLYNANSTQFEVSLDGFPNSGFSRYSFEHVYLSMGADDEFSFKTTKYLDDEFTPGVFDFQELDTTATSNAYFGWKQAGYHASKLDLNDLLPLGLSLGMDDLDAQTNTTYSSIVNTFFDSNSYSYVASSFNMTFGSNENDGGYDNLLAWTGQVGLGDASYDQVSATVIGITVTGIAIPIAVIVFGGVFVFLMKRRRAAVSGDLTTDGQFAYGQIDNNR